MTTRNAFYKIIADLRALIVAILEDVSISNNTKVDINTLADSALRHDLSVYMSEKDGGDPVISALFNNYVEYLEWDRPAKYGKRPPIDVLEDWARKNGIGTEASTLWAISTAIWRDGHKGRPIFATISANLDRLFMDDWSNLIFNDLTQGLDEFFK